MKRKYFGTDGVRGKVGGDLINPGFIARLARAAGQWCGGGGLAVIGYDTRASGPRLARAAAEGLHAAGCEVQLLGVLPTPAVSLAVVTTGATLGVVLTASHNPATDNGIKFFNAEGRKLSDDDEAAIEALLVDEIPACPGDLYPENHDAIDGYVARIAGLLPAGALSGWRVALDCANGATASTSPAVLRALGAELSLIGVSPDGLNINDAVGSEHPQKLAEAVVASGARIGIAHDGDGDRCVICDELGDVVDGDQLLALLAVHAKSRGHLPENTLVVTAQSNLGLDAALNARGVRVVRTDIGDRHVMVGMRETGAEVGGESSGHLIFSKTCPTGDGLLAAVKVLEVMLQTGRPLSQLRQVMQPFPQMIRNLKVAAKIPLSDLPRFQAAIDSEQASLGSSGRVMVRYSGTESKLRLLVEGPDQPSVDAVMSRLVAAASAELSVI